MQSRLNSIFVLTLSFVLILGTPGINAQSKREEAIKRVFEGLSTAVEVVGEPQRRMRLEDRMRDYRIPGLCVVLIEKGRIEWVRCLGVREVGLPGKVDSATRFKVESLSKPIAAFAALRLVDKGLIVLDSPLKNYLRSWAIPANEFTTQADPTLRHLLSHSAGFNVFGVPTYKAGEPLPTLIQALNGIAPAKPEPVQIDYVPGTKVRYSGGGYSVLQQLLEDVSGKSFSALMRSGVLGPVGMKNSGFYAGMPTELMPVAAAGHQNNGKVIDGRWTAVAQLAAGGLVSTPLDIAKFDIEVMKAWNGGSKLMSRKTAREMLTRQKEGWGLGFEVKGEGNGVFYSHTGSGDGFRAIMVGFPAKGKGAVILLNGSSGSELRYELLRSLAREYDWGAFRAIERRVVPVALERMTSIAGTYEYSDGSSTEIFVRDGYLFERWRDLEPVRLYASSPTLFFTNANEEFEFSGDSTSKPTGLKWRGTFGEFAARLK